MNTVQANRKRTLSPLLYPAALLSLASLAWTTWSLVDLLGTGLIGITVAAGADIIWGSVILAEARGLRITIRKWNIVPLVGFAALLVVAALLAWHGINNGSPAMAVAGPFLPLGAKAVWVLALADMRDPAALTPEEQQTLAAMERGMAFEEAQHRIRMREREMGAELLMAEVSTDFDIELMRQDRARELNRRRPLELPSPGEADNPDVRPVLSAPDTTSGHALPAGGGRRPDIVTARVSATPDIVSAAQADNGADTPLTSKDTTVRPRTPAPRTPPDTSPADTDKPSVAALVRRALDNGIDDPDTVITEVRRIHHGADKDSVKRTLRREREKRTNYL